VTLEYKVTARSQYLNYKPIVDNSIFLIVCIPYFLSRYGLQSLLLIICFLIGWVLIHAIPIIILHVNYYHHNVDDILIYDSITKNITYKHNGAAINFNESEIKYIRHYLSYPERRNRSGLLPWDKYSYIDIKFRGYDSVIISSLMIPDFKKFPPMLDLPNDKLSKTPSYFFRMIKN